MVIAIFDDHQIIIDALTTYLYKQEGVNKVLSATISDDFIKLIQQNEVDIIVSDVLTDEGIGLEIFEKMHDLKCLVPIIVYSSIHSEFVKNELAELGVVAFVNKKESMDIVWQIIKEQNITSKLKIKQNTKTHAYLTEKEKEIVQLLAKGLAAKEIANLLGSSFNTVNNQKNNLIDKFGCKNSTELVLKLTQMGYIKL